MQVALVTEWLDTWRGGAETSTRQFLHHLMDAGVEVHVYTRSRPSPAPGVFVHHISGAAMTRTRKSVNFALRVERMLAQERSNIIHTFVPLRRADVYQPRGGSVPETVERNIALRRSPTARRLKRYANRFNLKQRYTARMERKMLEGPGRPVVAAISRYVAAQFERHYRLPTERIRLIYNGVDQDHTQPKHWELERKALRGEFGIADDEVLVLEVAHNFRLKGVQHWLEALKTLQGGGQSKVRSLVIGRGDSPRWHTRAKTLGLNGALEFVGPSERMKQFYHAADVLVHPTYYDPCSRVVLEAMACGLPCITTRWDGASEIITEGQSGFVLDEPDQVGLLAEQVARLCDTQLRWKIGAEARKAVAPFSMAHHAAQMLSLYEELSHSKRDSA